MRNPEDRPHRHREELPLVRVRRTGLPPVASPHATSACRVCCTSSPSVAATGSYARLLTRLAKLDLLAIDDWMIAPLRDTERRDLTEVIEDRARARLDPHRQSVARHRLARRHRRRQPGRRHLRPPAPRRAPHRAEGPLDAPDTPRPEDPHAGDGMSIPTPACTPAPRSDPVPRAASTAGASRPMDRTGGMENAHDTLAAHCTRVEARFPSRLGRTERRPYAPQARSLYSSNTTSRTGSRSTVAKPMGATDRGTVAALRRAFHFAGIRVPHPRNPCSTSAKYADPRGQAGHRVDGRNARRRRHARA